MALNGYENDRGICHLFVILYHSLPFCYVIAGAVGLIPFDLLAIANGTFF